MNRPLSISSLWVWHSICCLLALLACVPILWPQVFLPDAWEKRIISYAGWVVLISFCLSVLLIAATSFLLLLRLRNLRTLGYALIWAGLWVITAFLYSLMAWVADVPAPDNELAEAEPIQRTDKLYIPEETLTGPDALVIPIDPEPYAANTIAQAPFLTQLDEQHNDLLRAYVDDSPRWASYVSDDTFYTKPGHVVMIPPSQGGIPGLVHVAFRRLVEGDPLPAGYTIVKPGTAMPTTPEGSEQVPDLAVDLGGSHYLLLAWRGTSHADTAHRALNAALSTVNEMVAPLAKDPTPQSIQRMLTGKRNTTGDTPEILLSQPPAQYGTYQAEVYANPGEAGTLMLRVVNLEDGSTLRLFSRPAHFSDNPSELFRHDYPGRMNEQMKAFSVGHIPGLLPEKAPLFIIRPGEAHQFFGVAFEVVFDPVLSTHPPRVLLRRCYRVQAYEDPNAPGAAVEEDEAPSTAAEREKAEPPTPAQPEPQDTAPKPAAPDAQPQPPAETPKPQAAQPSRQQPAQKSSSSSLIIPPPTPPIPVLTEPLQGGTPSFLHPLH